MTEEEAKVEMDKAKDEANQKTEEHALQQAKLAVREAQAKLDLAQVEKEQAELSMADTTVRLAFNKKKRQVDAAVAQAQKELEDAKENETDMKKVVDGKDG